MLCFFGWRGCVVEIVKIRYVIIQTLLAVTLACALGVLAGVLMLVMSSKCRVTRLTPFAAAVWLLCGAERRGASTLSTRGSAWRPLFCSYVLTSVELIGLQMGMLEETHNGGLLELGRATIKHEDRLQAVEEDLEYAPQETKNVGVGEGVALLIFNRSKEMVEPDG